MGRPDWRHTWFDIATVLAQRATCPRAKVGAVVVSPDNRMLVGGYNGAASGSDHCIEVGCSMVNNHCVRAIHAECNALAYAARAGISVEGCSMYVSFENATSSFGDTLSEVDTQVAMELFACNTCRGVLMASGLKEVLVSDPDVRGVVRYG